MANPIDTYKKVNISQEVSQYRAVQLLLDGAMHCPPDLPSPNELAPGAAATRLCGRSEAATAPLLPIMPSRPVPTQQVRGAPHCGGNRQGGGRAWCEC